MDQQLEVLQRIEAELKESNLLARESLELRKKAGEMQATLTAELNAHIAKAREINDTAREIQEKGLELTNRARRLQKWVLPLIGFVVLYLVYLAVFKI